MVLTPHAIAGAAITSLFRLNPVTAFFAGFLSHFFLDLIPHWDYKLKSAYKDEAQPLNNDFGVGPGLYFDLAKTGFDAFLGLALSVLFFSFGAGISFWAIIFGAIGGILPDPLQVVYMKWRKEPLISLQKTHLLFHTSHRIYNPVLGVTLYCFIILFFLLLGSLSLFSW
ncbi:MAG: hypothetical protein WCV68_01420 [Candidatus Paceibacterota bacterium]|jgi:hypothetical protein